MRFSCRVGLVLSLFGILHACNQTESPQEPAQQQPGASSAPRDAPVLSALPAGNTAPHCRTDGYLRTELFGALKGPLNWSGAELECSGMPRPNGAGARLRFAGQVVGTDRHIAFIVALPDLQRDALASELGSKGTLSDESSGRFFTTWDLGNCWTDITSADLVEDSADQFDIEGQLFCVSPLAGVNGDDSISITELSFAGSLNWSAK